MLTVDHLSVCYGQHRALDDVSVKIAKGEVAVILGANGAGKSSLLRAIAGLSEGHAEGDISFNGVSLIGLSPDDIVTAGNSCPRGPRHFRRPECRGEPRAWRLRRACPRAKKRPISTVS